MPASVGYHHDLTVTRLYSEYVPFSLEPDTFGKLIRLDRVHNSESAQKTTNAVSFN